MFFNMPQPPKKKKGIQRIRKEKREKARRKRENETPHEREMRLERNRVYKAVSRSRETPQEREIRLERNRVYMAALRSQQQTSQGRLTRLERNRVYAATLRSQEIPQERETRLERNRVYMAASRLRVTPQEGASYLALPRQDTNNGVVQLPLLYHPLCNWILQAEDALPLSQFKTQTEIQESLNEVVNESSEEVIDGSRFLGEKGEESFLPFEPKIEIIQESSSEVEKQFREEVIDGRRIIRLPHFIDNLKLLDSHSNSVCKFSDMMLIGEERRGLNSGLKFLCNVCKKEETVWTDGDSSYPSMSINAAAVMGAMNTGLGNSKLGVLLASMEIPSMSRLNFLEEHNQLPVAYRNCTDGLS